MLGNVRCPLKVDWMVVWGFWHLHGQTVVCVIDCCSLALTLLDSSGQWSAKVSSRMNGWGRKLTVLVLPCALLKLPQISQLAAQLFVLKQTKKEAKMCRLQFRVYMRTETQRQIKWLPCLSWLSSSVLIAHQKLLQQYLCYCRLIGIGTGNFSLLAVRASMQKPWQQ